MKKYFLYPSVFLVGGVLYTVIELLYRGHTHWTMALAGGASLCLICFIETECPDVPLILRCAVGAVGICAVEFIFGYFVNILFDMKVWDYSQRRFNIAGQICLRYGIMWFFLCIPGGIICRYAEKLLVRSSHGDDGEQE